MAVDIQINGTSLVPQPKEVRWEPVSVGGKLDGSEALGAYRLLVLEAPDDRADNFNWDTFENQVLTSVQVFPPGETTDTGSATVYNSGAVSKSLKYATGPDYLLRGVALRILVVA